MLALQNPTNWRGKPVMKRSRCLSAQLPMEVIARSSSSAVTISKPPRIRFELSRLPKAPEIRSIRFKRTTPGVAARLLLAPTSTPPINISHPVGRLSAQQLRRIVPQYQCPLFVAHTYPHAVLSQFEDPEFYKQLKDREVSSEMRDVLHRRISEAIEESDNASAAALQSSGDRRRAKHTLPMSLVLVVPKKSVHKSAVLRTKIKLKLREALSLVVVRGATVGTEPEAHSASERRIIFKTPEGVTQKDAQNSPVLQGWTYIIRPSLEIYRCPWPTLVEEVSKALLQMNSQADVLERKWAAEKRAQRSQRDKSRQPTVQPPVKPESIGDIRAKTSRNPTRRLDGYSGSRVLDAEGDIRGAARPPIQKQKRPIVPQAEIRAPFGPSKSRDPDQQSVIRTKMSNRHKQQASSIPPRLTRAPQDTAFNSQKPAPQPHPATDAAHRLPRRFPPPTSQNRTAPETSSLSPGPGGKPTRGLFKSSIVLVPRTDSGRQRGGGPQDDGGRGGVR